MKSSKPADAIIDNLLSLQADSLALVAVYDEDDMLRYANGSFRVAYHLAPGEESSSKWS